MVKEKPNSTRVYDEEGYRRRAACICVRSESETEVNNFILSSKLPKIKPFKSTHVTNHLLSMTDL